MTLLLKAGRGRKDQSLKVIGKWAMHIWSVIGTYTYRNQFFVVTKCSTNTKVLGEILTQNNEFAIEDQLWNTTPCKLKCSYVVKSVIT